MKINGYYAGCVNSGNIGDDILFHIFLNMLSDEISEIFNVTCGIVEEHLISKDKEDYLVEWIISSKLGVLGGGSLLHPEEISYTIPIKKYSHIVKNFLLFGTGISDTPKYMISDTDRKYLLNGNFNIKFPINNLMQYNFDAVNEIKFGGLRGPLESSILKSYNKKWIYDPGILADKYLKYNKKNKNKNYVGINIANITGNNRICVKNESYEEYMNRYLNLIIDYCKYLIKNNYNLYFYAMSVGEMGLNQKIIKELNYHSNITTHNYPLSFSDLMSISDEFRFAIATRLHANILINSKKIPTINLMYNCKSINYMHSINAIDYGLTTDEDMSLENIIKTHNKIINNYPHLTNNLSFHINRAYAMYKNEIKSIINAFDFKTTNNVVIKYSIYNNLIALFQINS